MAKVRFKLKHEPGFDEDEFDDLSFGQAHWWLKQDGGDFVRLPRKVRGCDELDLSVDLEPGSYLLGTGPRGGVRETITVADEVVEVETSGDVDLTGEKLVFTGDLECMDRDAAKALVLSLGGKVTGSVSGKTTLLVIGDDPGQSKIGKAKEKGVKTTDEAGFKKLVGLKGTKRITKGADVASVASSVLAGLNLLEKFEKSVTKVSGPEHFKPLGRQGQVLWAIAHGPRGGSYVVHVDLRKKKWGMQCNCSGSRPCKHACALVMLAANDLESIPEKKVPSGHKAEAEDRYNPFSE